jgi:ABC-type glycerol-3-phosphate transport system substrate-binding protein
MNYGIYKGKRYLIPLSYTIDALFTSKGLLEEKGIDNLSQDIRWEDISKLSEGYQKNQGVKSYLLPYLSFSSVLKGLDSTTIDIENKTSRLTSDSAKNALELYKTIFNSVLPESELSKKASNGDISALLNNGDIVFSNAAISGPQMLWYNYLSFKAEVQPEVYAVKNSNNKVPSNIDLFAAISSKCTNKEAAYEFISMLLSNDNQTKMELYGIPVCKTAYKEKKDKCIKGTKDNTGSQGGRGGGLKTDDSIKLLFAHIDDIISDLDACKIEDNQIGSTLDSKVTESISKNDTDENILKLLAQEVDKYFKEGLKPANAKSGNSKVSDASKKAKLSIFYMDYNHSTKNALRKSRDLYPEIEFDETVFENAKFEEMNTKLSTELMAGEGPDIIVFDTSIFSSLYKVANSGIFTDLNQLISNDKEFSKSDYYENIFDCGIYNNKRVFIPLEYSVPLLRTTDATLIENNINVNKEGITLESLSNLAKSFNQSKHKSKNLLYCNFGFSNMMNISGIDFVDYKNKKTNYNTKEFIKLLKDYKDVYPSIASDDTCVKYKSYVDMTKDSQIVFGVDPCNESPQGLWSLNSWYKAVAGQDMQIIPLVNNGTGYARIGNCVGINSNCKNKEAAFKILKIMLSKDLQKDQDSYGNNNIKTFLPINKQAFTEGMEFFMENTDHGFSGEHPLVPLPKEIADKITMVVDKVQPAQLVDTGIRKIINESVENYIKGNVSAEQTAKAIDEKVTLFLNE